MSKRQSVFIPAGQWVKAPTCPPVSRLAQERIGTTHAALLPLVGEMVITPEGPGLLLCVARCCSGVLLLKDKTRVHYFPTPALWPAIEGESNADNLA